MRIRMAIAFLLGLVIGGAVGAWLFVDTRARSYLAPSHCTSGCWSEKELGGL
jgi:hypothetical protein